MKKFLAGLVILMAMVVANSVHFTMSGTVSGNTLSGTTSGDLSGNITFTTNEEFDYNFSTIGLTHGTFTYGDGSNMSGVFSGGIVNNTGNLEKGTMIVNSGDGTYQYTSLLGVFRIVVNTSANTWSGEVWGDMSDSYNKSDIDTMVSSLQSNDTAQQTQINDLITNVTLLSANDTALWQNASAQEQEIQNNQNNITDLWDNASAQETEIQNNAQNISDLWNNASAQQKQINDLMASTGANISKLQSDISSLRASISSLSDYVHTQVERLDARIDSIEEQVQELEPSYEQTIYPFGADESTTKVSKFYNIDKVFVNLLDTVYNGATPQFSGVRVQKCVVVPADINIGYKEGKVCWTEPKYDAELKFDDRPIHIIIGPENIVPYVSWDTGKLTITPTTQVKWFTVIKHPHERAVAEIHTFTPNSQAPSYSMTPISAVESVYCSNPYLASLFHKSC